MIAKLRTEIELKRYGKEYTFTRTTKSDPTNTPQNPNPDAAIDAAYKHKHATTTTFTEWAKVWPARAYAIHSDVQEFQREGGTEMSGIINIKVNWSTSVVVGDTITTAKGIYDLVAVEDYEPEYHIYEGHKRGA